MTNKLPYTTLVNPDIVHQVVFLLHANKLIVSCNCLAGRATNGNESHKSIGRVEGDLSLARHLYNDSKNHGKPFGKDDEAKW